MRAYACVVVGPHVCMHLWAGGQCACMGVHLSMFERHLFYFG